MDFSSCKDRLIFGLSKSYKEEFPDNLGWKTVKKSLDRAPLS